jgi:histidinol-phosphatase (PHP family)
MIDHHLHTHFGDGQDSPNEMALAAKKAGVDVMGFSEHFPRPTGYDYPTEGYNHSDLASKWFDYASKVNMLKEDLDEPPKVLFGAEIDYLPDEEKTLQAELSAFNFDFIIGSVHMIGKWGFDYNQGDWDGRDVDELYDEYWETMFKMVGSGLFDFVGHLDVIKVFKNSYPPTRDHTDGAKDLLREIQKKGLPIEINTGGLRKPCRELFPSIELIKEAVALNIPIVTSSDAHRKEDVGFHLPEVVTMLKDLGVKEVVYFEGRRPTPVGLI